MIEIRRIRLFLISRINSRIVIIYFGNRNKRERFDGILLNVYNNIFIIKLSDGSRKSFNIIDILTKTIQIYI